MFVSTAPAELILLTGPPVYQPVAGTKLVWVGNTESDVFRLGPHGPVYYLVAGRWFSAPGFTGPWTFATPTLPEDFKKIPLEHPRSRVLASVPGTQQAAEGVLIAQVPQTARVNKKTLKAPEVAYMGGEPKFEKVEKTKVERAVNTDKSIIKVGDMYYMCYEGVWFMGSSPNGPWTVASKVPGEIYEIPISSPAHTVTYVTVEDDDDEWATFATAAMYTGVMVAWGCAVWGSGWYYPPYYGGFYGGYPMYRGYYPSYGYGASYNPWTGAYGRGAVAYGPYGGAGVGAQVQPADRDLLARRRGLRAVRVALRRPGLQPAHRRLRADAPGLERLRQLGQHAGPARRQLGLHQPGHQPRHRHHHAHDAHGQRRRRRSHGRGPGGTGGVARTGSGDVYAGRDGNVYRGKPGGGWTQHEGGNWGVRSRRRRRCNSTTMDQLNRDYGARTEGRQRTSDYGSYRSGSSGYSGSSYRSSGSSRSGGGGGPPRRRRPAAVSSAFGDPCRA